jgi:hypothetical protein
MATSSYCYQSLNFSNFFCWLCTFVFHNTLACSNVYKCLPAIRFYLNILFLFYNIFINLFIKIINLINDDCIKLNLYVSLIITIMICLYRCFLQYSLNIKPYGHIKLLLSKLKLLKLLLLALYICFSQYLGLCVFLLSYR